LGKDSTDPEQDKYCYTRHYGRKDFQNVSVYCGDQGTPVHISTYEKTKNEPNNYWLVFFSKK
jgi:hypothetical protein